MRAIVTLAPALALVLAPLSAPVSARSPGDIQEIWHGLLAIAVGERIQSKCDSISPRMIRAINLRNQLISIARAAGFTDGEIRAFVEDPIATDNLKAQRDQYLAERGAMKGDDASYCAVGAREIAQNTAVGRLLKS
ncbi:MAG: DUF5333 domain-containing protein [Pseudomonadota bacterium]